MFNGVVKREDVISPLNLNVTMSFTHNNVSAELVKRIATSIKRNEPFGLRTDTGKLMIVSPEHNTVIHPDGTIQKAESVQQLFDTISMALFRYKQFVKPKHFISYYNTIKALLQ